MEMVIWRSGKERREVTHDHESLEKVCDCPKERSECGEKSEF